ncbi:VCBS repeat-containing protein [uncultured Eubacterium sp.]|uniref:FG-GAP repeat domain-containing protein n=1 Tax=uncultured Eubacterium sp. TaxID=165185 RepID=UPI002612E150|nr:VCBS repeat-containing protein [uncultured Eubacterium sp.]
MKYIKVLLCIVLIVTLFSGCSFRLASSVNDLISAVAPFGENADVKSALDSFLSNGYSLKNPSSGEFITSYNFYDLDGDEKEEAVAFYEPNDNLGTIRMAIIKEYSGKWEVVSDISGYGDDAYRLDFADLNNDGKDEIIVCWNNISNSNSHLFVVYNLKFEDKKFEVKQINKDEIYLNNYVIVDFNQTGNNEILMFEINSGTKTSAKAELYSLNDNNLRLKGETKLDSRVISYRNINVEKAEGDIRVYADAIGSNGNSIRTEVIYWSNMYDSIVSPFYSYSTGRTSGTSRGCLVNSCDINEDERIEIPTDTTVKGLPKNIKPLNWKIYNKTILVHTNYSLYVKDDNYNVIIPDKYFKNISATYNKKTREMTVINKKTKTAVFSIMPVLKAVYDENIYRGYDIILDKSGYYYLAKTSNDKEIKISIDELKQYIKIG